MAKRFAGWVITAFNENKMRKVALWTLAGPRCSSDSGGESVIYTRPF